jgi:alkylation response protein AidB-like acyl-CoA dehydrogenase
MRTPFDPLVGAYWGGRRRGEAEPDAQRWCERMASRGWTVPTWPAAYGGGGLSVDEARVLAEELRRIGARPALTGIGIQMLGPLLLEVGTEEQKREHVSAIARGEVRWCQGYSEPAAGSDLASLQTRCEERGDHYRVNGQKIWTSYADQSDMIFCLVRTDPDVPRHDGISFVLIDMDQPGVTTRPIQLISGASPFCETFFDDARVEKGNLVGAWNGGWPLAKRLLQFERTSIGDIGDATARARRSVTPRELAQRYLGDGQGRVSDLRIRDRLAAFELDQRAFQLTMRRIAAGAKAGQEVGLTSSLLKYYGTDLNQRRHELTISILGPQALGWEGEGYAQSELDATRAWLRSRANSIEGGSSEIQLDIIAKRVLGLPS